MRLLGKNRGLLTRDTRSGASIARNPNDHIVVIIDFIDISTIESKGVIIYLT